MVPLSPLAPLEFGEEAGELPPLGHLFAEPRAPGPLGGAEVVRQLSQRLPPRPPVGAPGGGEVMGRGDPRHRRRLPPDRFPEPAAKVEEPFADVGAGPFEERDERVPGREGRHREA